MAPEPRASGLPPEHPSVPARSLPLPQSLATAPPPRQHPAGPPWPALRHLLARPRPRPAGAARRRPRTLHRRPRPDPGSVGLVLPSATAPPDRGLSGKLEHRGSCCARRRRSPEGCRRQRHFRSTGRASLSAGANVGVSAVRMATPLARGKNNLRTGASLAVRLDERGHAGTPGNARVAPALAGAPASAGSTSSGGSMPAEHSGDGAPSVLPRRPSRATRTIGGVAEPAAAMPALAADLPGV